MGRNTNWLMPQGYSPRVTRMDRVPLGSAAAARAAAGQPRTGPIKCADIPFTLVAGVPYNVSTANENRKSLILQNKDVTNNLFYRFGGPADANSLYIVPNGYILLDFVCPTDPVWVFALVAINGGYVEMSQMAE